MTEGPVERGTDADDEQDGEQVTGDRGANPDDTTTMSDEEFWAEAARRGQSASRSGITIVVPPSRIRGTSTETRGSHVTP